MHFLITIAYTLATFSGFSCRQIKTSDYISRPTEKHRSVSRHSDFWIGLYGFLWVESMKLWSPREALHSSKSCQRSKCLAEFLTLVGFWLGICDRGFSEQFQRDRTVGRQVVKVVQVEEELREGKGERFSYEL
ncbi:MAG: hypothetical protein AAGA60_23360 [Cyanobacteria bacterium P01_E01_bin.42]